MCWKSYLEKTNKFTNKWHCTYMNSKHMYVYTHTFVMSLMLVYKVIIANPSLTYFEWKNVRIFVFLLFIHVCNVGRTLELKVVRTGLLFFLFNFIIQLYINELGKKKTFDINLCKASISKNISRYLRKIANSRDAATISSRKFLLEGVLHP